MTASSYNFCSSASPNLDVLSWSRLGRNVNGGNGRPSSKASRMAICVLNRRLHVESGG